MDEGSREEVQRMIDELMGRLSRIRERFLGQPARPAEPPQPVRAPAAPAPPPEAPSPPLRGPASWTRPRWPSGAEQVREWLALFVVLFGLTAIVVGWFALGISETERAAAMLLGIIGTVLGYYFGQRGTTRAQDLAEAAIQRVMERADRLEAYQARSMEAESQAEFLRRILKAAQTDDELAGKLDELR